MKFHSQFWLLPVVILFLASPALGADKDLKSLMGENFQNLHIILNDLITSQYQTLIKDAGIIENHADKLAATTPSSAVTEQQRELFAAYANLLKMRTRHLIDVAQALQERDQTKQTPGVMNVDYLRVVIAEHFGQMITTCVLCHNQFRRRVL